MTKTHRKLGMREHADGNEIDRESEPTHHRKLPELDWAYPPLLKEEPIGKGTEEMMSSLERTRRL